MFMKKTLIYICVLLCQAGCAPFSEDVSFSKESLHAASSGAFTRGVSADKKSFSVISGKYMLDYNPEIDYIEIYKADKGRGKRTLALKPGGGAPDLNVLDGDNIRDISIKEQTDRVVIEITGDVNWAKYKTYITLLRDKPGLINSRIELDVKKRRGYNHRLFAGKHPELSYKGTDGKYTVAELMMAVP